MKLNQGCLLLALLVGHVNAAERPSDGNPGGQLLQSEPMDLTQTPYRADPTGVADSTKVIQGAVNDSGWLLLASSLSG
jgi:hypothetical protein